jgi:alkylation response protein AidB-like acyl-CoA dehydrogenase
LIEAGATRRVALAIVELERPGITRRPESERLGLRSQCRAELVFEDVFVASTEFLFAEPGGLEWPAATTALDHLIAAIAGVGIARAACQGAFRFAREQVHSGATVQERRKADRLLPRLRARLCQVRRSTRAAHLQRGLTSAPEQPGALERATVARVLSTEAAVEIVHAVSELCRRGTNIDGELEFLDGSTFWLEKLRRDARSLGDPGARFARAAPQLTTPAPRSIAWAQRSSLASG